MAWVEAQARLVTIVEAVVPSHSRQGSGARFAHVTEGETETLPDTRGFWFDVKSISVWGPITPNLPTRLRAQVALTVAYADDIDNARAQENIVADYISLITKLLDAAQWGRPTSTLFAVSLGADPELAKATIDVVEGARLLSFLFVVEFTATVPSGGDA
jgi:hypothetical protein